jgi:hypothetical protein
LKISELLHTVKAGARSNKYRIFIPSTSGKDFDVLCNTASLPGRNITPTEVWVKGRKAMIAGETTWQNTWQVTFYNDIDFTTRRFFWVWMQVIHNPELTTYDYDDFSTGIVSGLENIIGDKFDKIKETYDIIVNNFRASFISKGKATSFYQKDLFVEQLDHNENAVHGYRFIGAFPTNVDDVQLQDNEGDVSQTSVTFAYTNIEMVY